ncbi:hypothetical protein Tco_0072621 [Tanacetum coccineum]
MCWNGARFFGQKGSGGGRGVKEKNQDRVLSNEATKDGEVPYANVAFGNNNGTQDGPTSYAKLVTAEPNRNVSPTPRKSVNFRTLITSMSNEADVVVLLESIRAISKRYANTSYAFFLGKRVAYPIVANYVRNTWGWSSYARAMIELRADVELKDTIMVAMPKLVGEGFYTCTIRVEYEWKPLSQAPRGVLVGPKMGFKSVKQVYILVSKKKNANTSGDRDSEDEVEPVNNEMSGFLALKRNRDVALSLILCRLCDDEVESVAHYLISCSRVKPLWIKVWSWWIFDPSSSMPSVLVSDFARDNSGNLGNPVLKKIVHGVEYPGDYDSEDEVASADNDMARSMASERVCFGTQSLLEQWRDSYGNGDYDEDPYDDDMYEGHDIPQEIQAICKNLDIQV